MNYKALKINNFIQDGYKIIPIRKKDLESIRIWRNAQMDVLRQKKELSSDDQKQYFKSSIIPLFELENPGQILFSFFKDSDLIGYGGLVHISWVDKRAEMSFLVDNRRSENNDQYSKDLHGFIKLMKKLCFTEMKFNRLFTETYEFRTFHIKILELSGLVREGRMRQHIYEKNKFHDSIIHSILKQKSDEK